MHVKSYGDIYMKKILNKIKSIFLMLREKLFTFIRKFYLKTKKKELSNKTPSVFSSNCVGCMVLHDLGLQFNSPFVNLYLTAKDYLKFLSDPQKYLDAEFEEVTSDRTYPVGKLLDLTFYFVHYSSFNEAVTASKRRAKRINFDNLFVIFSERDGCDYKDLEIFDNLPFKNKVVFTHKPYSEIKSSFYISGFEKENELGSILSWDKKIGRKIYDRFDFVKWFNNH